MKFAADRPYANPEAAARKLLDLVRTSIDKSKLPHAYVGATNAAFLKDGGSVAEYTAGRDYAFAQKWFEFDRSQTRITLLPDGASSGSRVVGQFDCGRVPGLENRRAGAPICHMKRERFEARYLGWHVVRIAPDGSESTVEVWPEERAKHRAEILDQREKASKLSNNCRAKGGANEPPQRP